MTHAALSRDEKPGLQLAELVLLPFALMLALFRCFFGDKLRWTRRQRRSRPMPTNWRQHYDELRLAEWSVLELTQAGLAQLLSGKPLDLEDIETSDPPEDWVCPMPGSAFEMHRRIEAVLAFNADPEGRIRRLARRAVRTTAAAVAAPIVASLVAPLADPFPPSAAGWGRWIDAQRRAGGGIRAPPVPGIHWRSLEEEVIRSQTSNRSPESSIAIGDASNRPPTLPAASRPRARECELAPLTSAARRHLTPRADFATPPAAKTGARNGPALHLSRLRKTGRGPRTEDCRARNRRRTGRGR